MVVNNEDIIDEEGYTVEIWVCVKLRLVSPR